jgi:hypothetical protein
LDTPGWLRRVNPERIFHIGERVRLVVESNTDAYLYVFHQEVSGRAQLLFPNARVLDGENRFPAHEPQEVPEGAWFTFDNQPGDERLTLLLSHRPLPSIPPAAELLAQESFSLSAAQLDHLVKKAQAIQSDTAADDGQPISSAEGRRGLTLTTADPPPSRVVLESTANPGWVAVQLVLKHQ